MRSKERYTRALKDDLAELRERLGTEVALSTTTKRQLGNDVAYIQFRVQVSEHRWHVLAEYRIQAYEDDGSDRMWGASGLAGVLAYAFKEVERLELESKAQGALNKLREEI